MNRIIQICFVVISTLIMSCTAKDIRKEVSLPLALDTDYIFREYGIKYSTPNSFKIRHVSNFDNEDGFECVYVDIDRDGQFFIRLYKNYCNLNDIDPNYAWGYLKGCVAIQMKILRRRYKKIIESSHHVYSAQAIYFKPGSFISPTIVFDKKLSFNMSGNKYRFKSLAYAYKYNDSYYLIEIGYNTKSIDYDYNAEIYSRLMKSIVYP